MLALIQEFVGFREAGGLLQSLRPRRCAGVREARVLDEMILEVPGLEDSLTLNHSASAIWDLVDDRRSLAEIVRELEARFEQPAGALSSDVETAAEHLRGAGALELETVAVAGTPGA